MGVFVVFIVIVIVILLIKKSANKPENTDTAPSDHTVRIPICPSRCPNCGSPVRQQGTGWECGWCGDFGNCGYWELPNCCADEDIDLHNVLKDWEVITEAVAVLCPEPAARKQWAEHFAAYAISDAFVQTGSYAAHESLLLRFLKETKSSVPATEFEHLNSPLFQSECHISVESAGSIWTEIFSTLSPENAEDDPGELISLGCGMESLFRAFGDDLTDRGVRS